jgi:hypothetical protein
MNTSLLSALLLTALSLSTISTLAQPLNTLTLEEKQTGWRLLFDGKTLAGWRAYNKQSPPGAGWKVEDGLLKKVGGQRGGDIITEDQFGDFEFSWEWKISMGGNNGVKYLVTEQRPSAPGHEYQMIDDTGHPDGKLGAKRQTAAFYDVLPPAADKPIKPVGEWNLSRIIIQGNTVEHWLNGKKVLVYELGAEATRTALEASKFKNAPAFGTKIRGHIMLTDHQDECLFRNLKIRATEKR